MKYNCKPYVFHNEIFHKLSLPPHDILQLILCRFRPIVMLGKHSCEINTLHPLKGSVGLGYKNTFIDLSPFAAYLCDMSRLTLGAPLWAIGVLQGGATQADVANQFGVHKHTVLPLQIIYQVTGLAHDQPRSGRPRVTSQRQDVYIMVVHLRYCYQTAEATDWTISVLRRISGWTVLDYLRTSALQTLCSAIIAASPSSSTVTMVAKPPETGDLYSGKLYSSPMNRIFILGALADDKGTIVLMGNATGTAASPNDVTKVVAVSWLGGGGRITAHGRTPLVILGGNLNGQRYRDEVFRQHVLPFIRNQVHIMTLQQDNARPYFAHVMDFLRRQNIHVARIGRSSLWGVAGHPTGLLGKLGGVYASAMYCLR